MKKEFKQENPKKQEQLTFLEVLEKEAERNRLIAEVNHRSAVRGGLSIVQDERGLTNKQYLEKTRSDLTTFTIRLAAIREILKETHDDTFIA